MMKLSVLFLPIVFLYSLALVGIGCKPAFFGKFSGKILEPEHLNPMAGVKVRLDDAKYDIETDTKGTFSFDGVSTGNHTITCKFNNTFFEDAVVPIIVRSDIAVEVVVIPDIKSNAILESPKDTVKLSSLKPGCKLFKGGYGLGISKNVGTNNLVMVVGDKKRLIMRPVYFKGFVQLTDSVQTLEYVRLFTNLNTFYLFKDPRPDNSFIEVTATTKKPSYGEMPQDQFKRLGLSVPVVTNDGNHFYVTRYLLSTTHNLYKVIETIGFDGDYEMKKTLILTHMDVPIPVMPTKEK